jgi:hypothetical protein
MQNWLADQSPSRQEHSGGNCAIRNTETRGLCIGGKIWTMQLKRI